VVLFCAYYGTLAFCQRDSFVSSLDLADVDQAMWNTVHGDLMRITARPAMTNRLGVPRRARVVGPGARCMPLRPRPRRSS
jgi:hypothetical protein